MLAEAAAGPVPRVTIVIPVHNQVDFTRLCLLSIEESQASNSTAFEVVIVDNASTDETPELLSALSGDVRTISNTVNAGFGDACNQGAATSAAEFVLFLNNDTAVVGDWLDVLVSAMDEDHRRGAVQPKLIYPDGRLNDAGGLVFRGGEAYVYGKGHPFPDAPSFNVRRAPDYASGACLLVRRAAFLEVGGFDPRYAPAYYEDTDLSFALRAAGWTLLYEPGATVVHVEGGTAGTDESQGFKAYQPRNKVRFTEKWSCELDDRPVLNADVIESWAHRPQAGRGPGEAPGAAADGLRVLVLDPFPPMFDRASGSLRTFEIERALRELGHGVVHEALRFVPEREKYQRALSRFGIRLHGREHGWQPAEVYHPGHRAEDVDIVVVGPWDLAEEYLPVLRSRYPRAAVVVDSIDLHFVRERRAGARPERVLAQRQGRELAVYEAADLVVVVSETEAALLRDELPAVRTVTVGNAHRAKTAALVPTATEEVLFVGNAAHPPNLEGVSWFVREVWPLVLAGCANARLKVVGHDPRGVYEVLRGPSVDVLGWVEDTAPLLAVARVSVAPLLSGAGVKGKVGEALAHGVPVVTTQIGAEGMPVRDGHDVAVRDDPVAFSEAVLELLRNDDRWSRQSRAGLMTSARCLGPDQLRTAVAELVSSVRPSDAGVPDRQRSLAGAVN